MLMQKVNLPISESGNWTIEHFTISEEEAKFSNLRAAFSFSNRGSYISPGDYTALKYKGSVIMSDTPDEMRDHSRFVREAKGNVLINGLGIGMVLKNVLLKKEVISVTVNEISEDVIKMVAPHYFDERVIINCADAFTWMPPKGVKYDAIWHDIWPSKCADNLPEMTKLHRRYSKWLNDCCYQGSWGREEIRYRAGKRR